MKKKRILGLICLITILTATVTIYAKSITKLKINGENIIPEIPVEIKNGIAVGPIRQIAEKLGAVITWDEDNQTIVINDNLTCLQSQISLLEAAIDRSTPEIVAEQWAKAQMTRNGALEYALLSAKLRDEKLAGFEGFNFLMGASSPRVYSYIITKKEFQPKDSIIFEIELCFSTSTREKSYRNIDLEVEKDTRELPYQHESERWCVSSIDSVDRYGFAPGLYISTEDMEIPYDVVKTDWSGEAYDRGITFQSIISNDIPYIALGSTIQLQFYTYALDTPISVELHECILDTNGKLKYDDRASNIMTIEFEKKIDSLIPESGSFVLESNPAALLSSNSEDYRQGAVIRGFRVLCQWENKSCEYIFVLRSDAS